MSDEGDMLTCPYNRSHVISKLRMARHLVRCQANHPNITLATCYYDFLHRVPPEKLDQHLENCPSKFQFQVRFCTSETPSDGLDPKVQNIFVKPSTLNSRKEEDSNGSHTWTGNKGQGSTSISSTMNARHTPLGGGKTNASSVPKSGCNLSSAFLLKCSISDPKEPKGIAKKEKAKKASNPKEESWDTDSSEDDSEAKQGASISSTTTCYEYFYNSDNGSTHTGSSNSFQGEDSVDKDGFVKVYSKQKPKKKNVK